MGGQADLSYLPIRLEAMATHMLSSLQRVVQSTSLLQPAALPALTQQRYRMRNLPWTKYVRPNEPIRYDYKYPQFNSDQLPPDNKRLVEEAEKKKRWDKVMEGDEEEMTLQRCEELLQNDN